jgi:DNA-directed RNA polymerase specialized sigma24 family protein
LRADPDLATEVEVHRYVLVAIRTSALKLLKKRGRLVPVEDVTTLRAGTSDEVLKNLVDFETAHTKAELAAAAARRVRELPEQLREAVELLILREPPMKLREVAAIQDVAISTVHKRLKSALKELATALSGVEA